MYIAACPCSPPPLFSVARSFACLLDRASQLPCAFLPSRPILWPLLSLACAHASIETCNKPRSEEVQSSVCGAAAQRSPGAPSKVAFPKTMQSNDGSGLLYRWQGYKDEYAPYSYAQRQRNMQRQCNASGSGGGAGAPHKTYGHEGAPPVAADVKLGDGLEFRQGRD